MRTKTLATVIFFKGKNKTKRCLWWCISPKHLDSSSCACFSLCEEEAQYLRFGCTCMGEKTPGNNLEKQDEVIYWNKMGGVRVLLNTSIKYSLFCVKSAKFQDFQYRHKYFGPEMSNLFFFFNLPVSCFSLKYWWHLLSPYSHTVALQSFSNNDAAKPLPVEWMGKGKKQRHPALAEKHYVVSSTMRGDLSSQEVETWHRSVQSNTKLL